MYIVPVEDRKPSDFTLSLLINLLILMIGVLAVIAAIVAAVDDEKNLHKVNKIHALCSMFHRHRPLNGPIRYPLKYS